MEEKMEKSDEIRPFPLKFDLPGRIKQLRVERVNLDWKKPPYEIQQGHWRLWLMANGNFTLGTFIQLNDDGTINRVTWHEDGTESVFKVKQKRGIE